MDRYPRKWVMLAADLGGGVATGFLLLLYLLGRLEVFHLYLVSALTGALSSLHWPALSAMLEKKGYARASGMMSLAESLAGVGAPVLAAALLKPLGLGGVFALDLLGAGAAVLTLLLVPIPGLPPRTGPRTSLREEALYGFRFILERPLLLGLQLMFFGINPLTAVQVLGTALFALPWVLAEGEAWGPVAWGAVLYLGVVATALTTWLQTWGQRHVPAPQAAILYTLEPVWAAFFAYLALGERLSPSGLLGALLVLLATLLAIRRSPA